ncbi:MAG: TonB family protein [Myxococcales bacterium]|nr:TonB family protein [Myxococcales bacterium]
MSGRRNRSAVYLTVAFVVALGAHCVFVLMAEALGWLDVIAMLRSHDKGLPQAMPYTDAQAKDDRPLEIQQLVDDLQQPDERTEEEKRREEEKKKEEEDKNPHGQVVDVAKPLVEERPDKANYVSEYDTKVDREMKMNGRDHGGARDGAQPQPPALPSGDSPNARPPQPQVGKGGRPGPLAMRDLQRQPRPHGAESELPPDRDGEKPRAGQKAGAQPLSPRQATGEMGDGMRRAPGSEAPVGTPGQKHPAIMPTPDMLQRAIGKGGGSMDYLKDVDDGDATALNSKKWKHAPFFNRVKRAVAEEWHPEMTYVRHDPNGNVYGIKDRVTVLRIHLQPDGKLAGWTVLQSSGVDFLDDEAIDAFKKSAPFPNPPKDLVEADSQIHFNFAFIFELSGHGSLKVYKYQ